jgi:site-specific DNA recombinase
VILRPKEPIRSVSPDPGLITAIARAQHWRDLLTAGDVDSLEDIAEREGLSRRYVGYIIHLASLAPNIVEEILSGRMRSDLMKGDLLKRLPIDWQEQRKLLGYAPF